MSETEHAIVGQTVGGKYVITQLLGEGGMGAVYLGEQKLGATTRKVAVKTLHKHLSHDKSILARFEREVETVAGLEHPNTIQIFDYGKMDDGTLYIVMEYVKGASVADIILKEGRMAPARVENILRQVVGSLEEAHGKGIVHRDLKPDNVVLADKAGTKDWVEVLDFGIAKRSSEHDPNEAKLTQQGMVLGTPPYMSPEQFTGQPVDLRTDVYALGVMAYEMLSGQLPWNANTAWEWASKHMTEPPTPLERQPLGADVPEKMRSAINRALAKNKDERFSSVSEFFDAFSMASASVAPVPSMDFGPTSNPVSSAGAAARAKTEMGAPIEAPPYVSQPANPPSHPQPAPAPIAIPQGPAHAGSSSRESGGGKGLIIGLAALAGVLILGAVIAVFATRKPKPTTTTSLDLGGGTTAVAEGGAPAGSLAHTDEPPPAVTTATPLGGITPPPPTPGPATKPGGGKPTNPSTVPTPQPQQPKPPATDPPSCVQARNARAKGLPASVVTMYANQCRAAGGTP